MKTTLRLSTAAFGLAVVTLAGLLIGPALPAGVAAHQRWRGRVG